MIRPITMLFLYPRCATTRPAGSDIRKYAPKKVNCTSITSV